MGFQLHGKQIEHSQHVIQKMLPCIPTHRPKKRSSGWNDCHRHRNGTTARPVSASENLHPITRRLKPARGLAVPHKRANPQQEPCPFVHTKSVAWPFWQVRTRVHMVFKTSYKTKLAVYWYANRTRYQKALKRSSLSWYWNVYKHKARRLCAEIWRMKASVGRIPACTCLCKLSERLVLCWLFEFFPYFEHEQLKRENNWESAFIYFQLIVLNISIVCHWKKKHIYSPGVNFPQNSCWYLAKRGPNTVKFP